MPTTTITRFLANTAKVNIIRGFVKQAIDARSQSKLSEARYQAMPWQQGGNRAFADMVRYSSVQATCLLAAKMLAKHMR